MYITSPWSVIILIRLIITQTIFTLTISLTTTTTTAIPHIHIQTQPIHKFNMFSKTTIVAFLTSLALTSAAPADEISARQAPAEIAPTTVIGHALADAWDNYCSAPTSYGYIARNVWNGQEYGQTTLFTFTYPAASAGKQCWLDFYHAQPSWISNTNGIQVDVFTSWGENTCNAGDKSNKRDANLGRLNVPATGAATWAAKYSTSLTQKGPCKAPGSVERLELVAVGDNTGLSYPQGPGAGLRILYA